MLSWLAWRFVRHDTAPDVREVTGGEVVARTEDAARISRDAAILILAFAFGYSLLGYDLIMSLATKWVSNLFGAFYFMGSFLAGLMLLAVLAIVLRRAMGLAGIYTSRQQHDLGKLCFGFTVFWAYLMWSQFLVIWYGNLPEETYFIFYRLYGVWRPVGIAVFLLVFLIPFVGLLGVKPKLFAPTMVGFALVSLVGIWLERYLEVVPAINQGAGPAIGLPEIGVVDVWRLDRHEAESNGDMLANVQDPLTPPSLLLLEGTASPAILKQAPKTFSADGLMVTRHEAISVDGERIPYVQTGPAAETGDAPVYMSAYGGFGLAVKPYYNSALGKLWLERGGTTVQANIRGGGEFGTRWHDAGRYAGKRLAHDDFAAVAADLVKRGVTRANRIAAEGGSNGGILITNMLVRYPQRFGALFCTIPLIDMRRYTKLLAGASWIAEYGDPDKPAEWEWLKTYSAYHAAIPGQNYPPILIATTRRDDRVHPGHARKMAAKLQAMGYEAWFYEPAAGGHGYGKDNRERAGFIALGYAFLRNKIGWADNAA